MNKCISEIEIRYSKIIGLIYMFLFCLVNVMGSFIVKYITNQMKVESSSICIYRGIFIVAVNYFILKYIQN
jgi:hypothetical protein